MSPRIGLPAIDFVIITALEEEREAILSKLPNLKKLPPSTDDIRVYFQSDLPVTFPDGSTSSYSLIVLSLLNMGRLEAANATGDAIRRCHPRYVILVGIAGGISDAGVLLGDVIVSDQIIDYELQKLTSEKSLPRDSVHRADPRLLTAVQNLRSDDWLRLIVQERPEAGIPKRIVGPIATGDKIVERQQLIVQLLSRWPKLIGVEMEAGGAASASFQAEPQPGFFMIRGVSDLADEDKESTRVKAWRSYACDVAASYTVALLQSGPVPAPAETKNPSSNVNQSGSSTRRPFILPQLDVSTFSGRDDEIRRLEMILLDRHGTKMCSIVGLSGTGGIGKTGLACHFAELHKDDFPDGVIGLRVDGKDVDTIAREFARCYGEEIDPDDERDAATIMQDIFGSRRALLIFDNAVDAGVRSLRPGGDNCAVIITTRDRQLSALLDVPTEGRLELPPLPDPDSLILLEKLIGRARVQAEQEAAGEIIRLVGNLPLAIQIVGAILREQEWRALTDYQLSLYEERERVKNLRVRGDEFLDVRASFSLSLSLLEQQEIDFFACLSICPEDGFSMQSAKATAGCSDTTAHEYLGRLHRLSLLNRSLLGTNRFIFHPLIRLFAQELAADRGLQEDAEKRHAEYYIEFVRSSRLSDPEIASRITEELNDIILAAEWLQHQEISNDDIAIRLQPFFERAGYWQQAVKLLAGFLAVAERQADWRAVVQLRIQQAKYLSLRGDLQAAEKVLEPLDAIISKVEERTVRERYEAMWLMTLGGVLRRQGRWDKAISTFERSARIEEHLGNRHGQAMALNVLGGMLQRQGKFDEAAGEFQRSYELLAEDGDRRGQAKVLTSLGGVFQRQGKLEEAVKAYERSAKIERELDNSRGLAMVLYSLGGVLQRQGKLDEAVDALNQSATIEEQVGDKRHQAMVLNSLGEALQVQARLDEAADAYRHSAEISEGVSNKRNLAMALNGLGGVLQRLSKFIEAEEVFRRSCAISEELKDQRGLAMALNGLGGVLQRLGRFGDALEELEQGLAISEELDDKMSLAVVLNTLGGVLQRLGRFGKAEVAFQRSYNLLIELDDHHGQAMVLNSLGGVLQRLGKFDEAEDTFQRSARIGESIGDKRHQAMALNSLGGVLQRQGRFDDAVDALRRSAAIEEELGNQRGQAMVLNSLGGVLQRQGRFDEALKDLQRSYTISKQMGDQISLAMVHFTMGKTFLAQRRTEEAVTQFHKSYEINLKLRHAEGLGIVTQQLIPLLMRFGKRDEAMSMLNDAFSLAPNNKRLKRLIDQYCK
jgi:tetratricopeptide (TPR) repeat protein/nucleoside phosphorylase